jgi:hypothetical protein
VFSPPRGGDSHRRETLPAPPGEPKSNGPPVSEFTTRA